MVPLSPKIMIYGGLAIAFLYISNLYAINPENPFQSSQLLVGWRASEYGYMYQENPDYWVRTAQQMSQDFAGSKPAGIWIVGTDYSDGNCGLSFPDVLGTNPDNIVFDNTDRNERYLDAFDYADMAVWLQVEPADADVEELIDLTLSQYAGHKSVYGFGVDVEWLNSQGNVGGRQVTDEEARMWMAKVKSYNPRYKLFLKHWDYNYMPPTYRNKDLIFICDSIDYENMDELIDDFEYQWSDNLDGSEVGYQVGYNLDYQNNGGDDSDWWGTMQNPLYTIGHSIIDRIPDTGGIYWVDFSIKQQYP